MIDVTFRFKHACSPPSASLLLDCPIGWKFLLRNATPGVHVDTVKSRWGLSLTGHALWWLRFCALKVPPVINWKHQKLEGSYMYIYSTGLSIYIYIGFSHIFICILFVYIFSKVVLFFLFFYAAARTLKFSHFRIIKISSIPCLSFSAFLWRSSQEQSSKHLSSALHPWKEQNGHAVCMQGNQKPTILRRLTL